MPPNDRFPSDSPGNNVVPFKLPLRVVSSGGASGDDHAYPSGKLVFLHPGPQDPLEQIRSMISPSQLSEHERGLLSMVVDGEGDVFRLEAAQKLLISRGAVEVRGLLIGCLEGEDPLLPALIELTETFVSEDCGENCDEPA